MKTKKTVLFLILCCISLIGNAQPAERLVKVSVVPNSENWEYRLGEKAKFDIRVTMNGVPLKNIALKYEFSYDMMEPFKKDSVVMKTGIATIGEGTMKVPGFLRCIASVVYNGVRYEGRGTAAFEPQELKPTVEFPADFDEFWAKEILRSKELPMNPHLVLLPERCSAKSNVYALCFESYRYGLRMYGILCMPKASGRYPAVLSVPGAGVYKYTGDVSRADKGFISLQLGIHGIPVTQDYSIYESLRNGALDNYAQSTWLDRNDAYYKRVYIGCARAVDFLLSLPECDDRVIVTGGSQGGALAIVTATLNPKVTGLIAFYPALSDLTGYLHNRAGGWPHIFKNNQDDSVILQQKVKCTQYYDVINFARKVKVPGFYGLGYNDMICPPTTTYAVYNSVNSKKELLVVPEIGHWTYPEMWDAAWNWCNKLLLNR